MAVERERDPIILFGAPRSGTTYLETILNAHPDVFITHESRVFAWLHQALALTGDDRFLYTERAAFLKEFRSVLPQAIREVYRRLAPDARYWGDKNPHYADPYNRGALELVAELFPGSRFVHIIRDGRDVVSSLLRKQTGGKPWVTFEQAHYTWKTHVRLGRAFGQALPETRYLEVRYEDLVADDAGVAGRILDFLGIDQHPAVYEFCRGQQEHRTPFKGPTRDLGSGITASDWASLLDPEQQAESLALIGGPLVRYGYETEESLEQLRRRTAEQLP